MTREESMTHELGLRRALAPSLVLLALFIAGATTAMAQNQCSHTPIKVAIREGRVTRDHYYCVIRPSGGVTQNEARNVAVRQRFRVGSENRQGVLASLEMRDEFSQVTTKLRQAGVTSLARLWVAGSKRSGCPVRSHWSWDTGIGLNYNAWAPGEPNNNGKDCRDSRETSMCMWLDNGQYADISPNARLGLVVEFP